MKNYLAQKKETSPVPCLSVDELYLGCLAQNPRTQRELFDRLYPRMMSICLRYVRETAAVEDVLLVAFRKVFDRISQFRQTGSFEGWIRKIVVNECLMYLDKKSREFRETGLEKVFPLANQVGPEDLLLWEDMIKMVGVLPAGYRTVFELFVLEGLSHEEIGKRLSISESTSKSQLSRARIQLQRMLRFTPRLN